MKSFAAALLSALLVSGLAADAYAAGRGTNAPASMRVVDATDACVADCANQSASCKRACPATFTGPCTSSCDSQEQICRQACRPR